MKRTLTIALALCLMLACLGVRAQAVPVTLDDIVAFSRPDTLSLVELNEEDAADGLCYAASSDELEVYVYKLDTEGRTADEIVEEYLADDTLENVAHREVGSLDVVSYALSDEDAGAVIPTDQGFYYEFFFYFVTDDAKAEMEAIVASIAAA